jgi:hypothetical protein
VLGRSCKRGGRVAWTFNRLQEVSWLLIESTLLMSFIGGSFKLAKSIMMEKATLKGSRHNCS